ncbi:18854_t:CDS:2 [Rhizophagus irregularis]|nr:18854_t:CDS:2 [Rhizophagus irregularis]
MPPHKKMRSRTEGDVIKSGPYTNEEDAQLIELYEQHSDKVDKWKIIAVDKSDLTADEKREIDDLQTNPCYNKKYRNKWPEIAKKLSLNRKQGRRTELQIKNYWNSKERTQKQRNKTGTGSHWRLKGLRTILKIEQNGNKDIDDLIT